jgi:hypothetical protein
MTEELRTYLLYELGRIVAHLEGPYIAGVDTRGTPKMLTSYLRDVVAQWDENTVVPEWFLEAQRAG